MLYNVTLDRIGRETKSFWEFRWIKLREEVVRILWNSARGGGVTLEILIKADQKADHVRESRLYSSLLAIPNNVRGVYENSFIYFPAGSWDMNWMFLNAPRLCRIFLSLDIFGLPARKYVFCYAGYIFWIIVGLRIYGTNQSKSKRVVSVGIYFRTCRLLIDYMYVKLECLWAYHG